MRYIYEWSIYIMIWHTSHPMYVTCTIGLSIGQSCTCMLCLSTKLSIFIFNELLKIRLHGETKFPQRRGFCSRLLRRKGRLYVSLSLSSPFLYFFWSAPPFMWMRIIWEKKAERYAYVRLYQSEGLHIVVGSLAGYWSWQAPPVLWPNYTS